MGASGFSHSAGTSFTCNFHGWSQASKPFTGILMLLIGFGVILAFYLLFNLLIAGTPFPNTFYAKQAEYAVLQNIPFITRFSNIALLPLIGAGIILLPGTIFLALDRIGKRDWAILAGMIWFLGYIVLYALRLPVTYQHGRYLMPAMPISFIWGLAGMFKVGMVISKFRWKWALMKAWQISAWSSPVCFLAAWCTSLCNGRGSD